MAAITKKHEARHDELCAEMAELLKAGPRPLIWKVEENTKTRAAFCLLEDIRALQQTDGYDAEKIIEALISKIKNCCDIASRTDLSLLEAAEFIVPVAVSGAEKIKHLRAQAAGRYLSAAKPGAYQFDEATMPERVAMPVSAGRMIEKEV